MARKTILWILLVLVSVGGVLYAFKYFPEAFPIVSLDLKMDRDAALESARSLAEELDWGPRDFKQAASFSLDERTQNYVELEAGGSDAFRRMLQEGLYEPYTWRVRHFAEGEANETAIRFMPEGDPYGFREKLPEDDPGASLTPEEACAIARDAATGTWGIDLSAYELVEESQKVQPGGRTDHTFVYERPDVQIGEGKYRLRLVVGGDKLTELMHFVKIPEAFDRRYEEMRSANNTISYIGVLGIVVLYFLGGCVVGLIILLRQRAVLWRKALLWGMSIALLQVLTQINRWPLAWMDYDTALSSQGYLLQQILQLLIIFAAEGILLTVTFMAAESLTRKAFPDHIQLWRLWSPGAASSKPVLGRTIGGYLSIGFSLGFVVAVYFVSSKFLGWWTPSGALFEPDVLATYCPWLSSIAISLHAGFWEECLFRAVPLAGAALIGQRLGHRRAWIIGALIIQALIFGAGHASYATQPAYARVVELIIPSFVFAGIYLRFGLLPAIISHFTFDVVWFALPLFVASSSGIWVDQILVILLTLIPLWVVLIAGLRAGRWGELRDDFYNRMWQPSVKAAAKPVAAELSVATEMKGKNHGLLLLGGLVGLILWFLATDFQTDAPPITTSRGEVEVKARETLTEQGEAKVKARE
ncbi:MAG: CPBP family intramembrane metalloprotease, partial [Candidatus Eisenbacteria sp.]|nr:CPBP family intramembrane metalloprotease [Candidatus Eisenbacteria bacterium]